MKLALVPGKLLLFLASMAFLTGVSFFIVGAYLASWPIMRLSPRDRRIQAIVGLGLALMTTVRAYGLDKHDATDAPEATES